PFPSPDPIDVVPHATVVRLDLLGAQAFQGGAQGVTHCHAQQAPSNTVNSRQMTHRGSAPGMPIHAPQSGGRSRTRPDEPQDTRRVGRRQLKSTTRPADRPFTTPIWHHRSVCPPSLRVACGPSQIFCDVSIFSPWRTDHLKPVFGTSRSMGTDPVAQPAWSRTATEWPAGPAPDDSPAPGAFPPGPLSVLSTPGPAVSQPPRGESIRGRLRHRPTAGTATSRRIVAPLAGGAPSPRPRRPPGRG